MSKKWNPRALALAAAVIALTAAAPVAAHDAAVGPNGGPMVETKGHHLELVVKGALIQVHISDANHAAVASRGASGRAVVLAGKTQLTVPLAPLEPDKLAAKVDAPLVPGTRVVVSAKLASGQDLLARFVVK